jgi:prepilin-type N-terminal cleavage/methylation domain-containing protein
MKRCSASICNLCNKTPISHQSTLIPIKGNCYTIVMTGLGNIIHCNRQKSSGFTIVELLIVVVVISILFTITTMAFNGVQSKARAARMQSSINALQKAVQLYQSENGAFPVTTNNPKANWRAADARTDSNCTNGSSQADWIPGVTAKLPASDSTTVGVDGIKGCYIYVSDGTEYVISAWNMVPSPQTVSFYRRVGFRPFQSDSSTQFYTCNENVVGGVSGGTYQLTKDYYKHSYTVSNITSCNETAP